MASMNFIEKTTKSLVIQYLERQEILEKWGDNMSRDAAGIPFGINLTGR